MLNLLPGARQSSDFSLVVNGLPSSSQTIMVEGMDATNGMWREQNQGTQQGVDAIQEVSVQTSNFAAEYGGAGGGYLNFTMKSGTNQYHGSGYDYFVNEFLDAGLPFSAKCNTQINLSTGLNDCPNDPNSGHIKNPVRRNDYGFTLGGPVRIPKVYNGKDKTFFFFNFEQFLQSSTITNGVASVPSSNPGGSGCGPGAANPLGYAQGCFYGALGSSFLGGFNTPNATIPGGISYGQMFDPNSRTAGGAETPFPNNSVPMSPPGPGCAVPAVVLPDGSGRAPVF